MKLFLLGTPGSGKSTIARHFNERPLGEADIYSLERINDYTILREMAYEEEANPPDEKDRWFRLLGDKQKFEGFDVLNVEAFDQALKNLEEKAKDIFTQNHRSSPKKVIVTIEFARNDYQRAFKQFNREFLQDAHILYLNTRRDICKDRIHRRVAHRCTDDDYDVSDYIFQEYYNCDQNKRHLENILVNACHVPRKNILVLDNNGKLEDVYPAIAHFFKYVIANAANIAPSHEPVPANAPLLPAQALAV